MLSKLPEPKLAQLVSILALTLLSFPKHGERLCLSMVFHSTNQALSWICFKGSATILNTVNCQDARYRFHRKADEGMAVIHLLCHKKSTWCFNCTAYFLISLKGYSQLDTFPKDAAKTVGATDVPPMKRLCNYSYRCCVGKITPHLSTVQLFSSSILFKFSPFFAILRLIPRFFP
jgi:hypothetical protein